MDNDLVFQKNRNEAVKLKIRNENGTLYNLQDGEVFAFGVKKTDADAEYSIYKEISIRDKVTNGSDSYYLLQLNENETDIPAGYYHYDIVVQSGLGKYPCVRYGNCVITKAVIE